MYISIDVEALGLHGPAFAVGYYVIDKDGKELESGIAVSKEMVNYLTNISKPPIILSGIGKISPIDDEYYNYIEDNLILVSENTNVSISLSNNINFNKDDVEWVIENVLPTLPEPNFETMKEVRNWFWDIWVRWKKEGAQMIVDCGWPVEAKFLKECIQDNPEERKWEGPYPLIEIGSIILGAGGNPTETFVREENELPAHNPLNDARQSARIFYAHYEYLEAIKRDYKLYTNYFRELEALTGKNFGAYPQGIKGIVNHFRILATQRKNTEKPLDRFANFR